MSRLTAAQIISLGEYLNPDFDATSLTVPQLLGVLGFHNVKYASPYTKSKLMQQFNEEIKPQASKLMRERLKQENSLASDDGIIDGVTGKPIGGEKSNTGRRPSRRTSRAPSEAELAPVRPDPPKRRRSSAQPALGEPSRKSLAKPTQPAVLEESEPEDEGLPVRKVGRSKKSAADAGSQARRVSIFGDDSGWEDKNIFQSGAESSSPMRPPTKQKTSRRSIVPRESRKSMSAPPEMSPNSSPTRPKATRDFIVNLPTQPKFEPRLPPDILARHVRPASKGSPRKSFAPVERQLALEEKDEADELNLVDGDTPVESDEAFEVRALEEVEVEIEADAGHEVDEEDVPSEVQMTDEEHTIAVSRRIADGGKVIGISEEILSPEPYRVPFLLQSLLSLVAVILLASVVNFKLESAQIGFCDTGQRTNAVLEAMTREWEAVEACNRENRTHIYPYAQVDSQESFVVGQEDMLCPPPPLIPFPHPWSCEPCPAHASCTPDTVTCDNGYILRSHPLLGFVPPISSRATTLEISSDLSPPEMLWKAISVLLDGLPGFGPVAFPPRCLQDPKRKRNIGVLGKAVEAMLGQERGRRLCAGTPPPVSDKDGGEARRWGLELEQLKNTMKETIRKTAPQLLRTFDDTFHEAIQQLILWGGITIGEDSERRRYLAHQTPDLTWNCAVTVKMREIWQEWRATVIGAIAVIVAIYLGKLRRRSQRAETKRIAQLVQIALDTLRNQEFAHHTDPVSAPHAYLSSLQLRDLIMQDEHSIPVRRRIWERVERVVEGNANVRANLEEVSGGDEMRVWRWVGGAGYRKTLDAR